MVSTQPGIGIGNNFICTGSGSINCTKDTILTFTKPVKGLTFFQVGDNASGVVALVDVFENNRFSATVNIIGDNFFYVPNLVDLRAFNNVTSIRIHSVTDPAGLGWDNFQFNPANEFTVSLSNFIPHDHVIGPPQSRCDFKTKQLYFRGDNRGFSAFAESFRSRQTVIVAATLETDLDANEIKDRTAPANLVGETRSYAPNALADGIINASDDDAVLKDCHFLHEQRTASNRNMKVDVRRLSAQAVEVKLSGEVGNPLVNLAPTTDWAFTLTIDASASPARWTLSGDHDGFPAYEIYINNMPIYTYDPGSPPYTFLDHLARLGTPMEIPVNRVGTLQQ